MQPGAGAAVPADASAGAGQADATAAAGLDETGAPPNQLTAEEAAEGFDLLFDGESLEAWRGYRMDDVPTGWSATGGALAFAPGAGGGDLITRATYADFDLRLEWRISEGGNSGIFFGVIEGPNASYESGAEMQVLDNAGHADGLSPLTSAGSNYALHAPSEEVARPAGEWNAARIVRRGNEVEYWLNGVRIVRYEIDSPEWKELVADSNFAAWPDYGAHHEGHLGLQDHGNPVWYRAIRVRRL